MKKGQYCVHRASMPIINNGKWGTKWEDRNVIFMASSGPYAMVRIPRCYPYICKLKELRPND